MKEVPFATRIPEDLAKDLDVACRRLGLRKNFVVTTALRETIEELLDAAELRRAVREATGFHPWEDVKRQASRRSAR